MSQVSFIIPSYNSLSTLPRTLESILRQTVKDFEIIIVDSSDDEMAKKQVSLMASERIKVISFEKRTIPAQGRNIGARAASGELLCFIDSDIVLAADWLENVLTAYAAGVLVGGGSVDIHPSQEGNKLAWAQLFLQFNESLPYGKERKIGLLPACNMFCQRKIFIEVGGFPEMRASEDVVLCFKLRESQPLWFVPQARSFHVFRESRHAYYKNQVLLGKYILFYRRDFLKSWYSQSILPLLFLPAFVAIKFYRITCRIQRNSAEYRQNFSRVRALFMIGLYFWTKGFVIAVFQKQDAV